MAQVISVTLPQKTYCDNDCDASLKRFIQFKTILTLETTPILRTSIHRMYVITIFLFLFLSGNNHTYTRTLSLSLSLFFFFLFLSKRPHSLSRILLLLLLQNKTLRNELSVTLRLTDVNSLPETVLPPASKLNIS